MLYQLHVLSAQHGAKLICKVESFAGDLPHVCNVGTSRLKVWYTK